MILEEINKLKNEIVVANKKISDLFKNHVTEDIDEKYDLYIEVEDLLPIHSYVKDLPSLDVSDYVGYDNLVHAERHTPVLYSYIVETLYEEFLYEFEGRGDISTSFIELINKGATLLGTELLEDESNADTCFEAYIEQLKKEIVDSGFRGFYYDW